MVYKLTQGLTNLYKNAGTKLSNLKEHAKPSNQKFKLNQVYQTNSGLDTIRDELTENKKGYLVLTDDAKEKLKDEIKLQIRLAQRDGLRLPQSVNNLNKNTGINQARLIEEFVETVLPIRLNNDTNDLDDLLNSNKEFLTANKTAAGSVKIWNSMLHQQSSSEGNFIQILNNSVSVVARQIANESNPMAEYDKNFNVNVLSRLESSPEQPDLTYQSNLAYMNIQNTQESTNNYSSNPVNPQPNARIIQPDNSNETIETQQTVLVSPGNSDADNKPEVTTSNSTTRSINNKKTSSKLLTPFNIGIAGLSTIAAFGVIGYNFANLLLNVDTDQPTTNTELAPQGEQNFDQPFVKGGTPEAPDSGINQEIEEAAPTPTPTASPKPNLPTPKVKITPSEADVQAAPTLKATPNTRVQPPRPQVNTPLSQPPTTNTDNQAPAITVPPVINTTPQRRAPAPIPVPQPRSVPMQPQTPVITNTAPSLPTPNIPANVTPNTNVNQAPQRINVPPPAVQPRQTLPQQTLPNSNNLEVQKESATKKYKGAEQLF
jgi:hypothetical protein